MSHISDFLLKTLPFVAVYCRLTAFTGYWKQGIKICTFVFNRSGGCSLQLFIGIFYSGKSVSLKSRKHKAHIYFLEISGDLKTLFLLKASRTETSYGTTSRSIVFIFFFVIVLLTSAERTFWSERKPLYQSTFITFQLLQNITDFCRHSCQWLVIRTTLTSAGLLFATGFKVYKTAIR